MFCRTLGPLCKPVILVCLRRCRVDVNSTQKIWLSPGDCIQLRFQVAFGLPWARTINRHRTKLRLVGGGLPKTSKEFYQSLISSFGCRPNEILMIGDDPEHDVAGPIASNMHALLIDRKSTNVDQNSIRSLDQLLSTSAYRTAF